MSAFNRNTRRCLAVIGASLSTVLLQAAEKTGETPKPDPLFTNGVFLVMLAFSILLLIAIVGMAEMVKAGAATRLFREKKKKEENDNSTGPGVAKTIALLITVSLAAALHAAETPAAVVPEEPFTYWEMGAGPFFTMLAVISVELLIFYVLYRTGMSLLRNEDAPQPVKPRKNWLRDSALIKSMTDADAPEVEQAILTDHDYDGIRELDNNLPAWWKYGFYLTIIVAVVYMLHYHVFGTGKSSAEEYVQEQVDAEKRIAEYKRSTANLVDENTVVRLTDAFSIAAGHSVFGQNCTPCHGDLGEGKEGLGPNLTDDYWLHGGSTADIFKSVKYGWTDKGMKSWEQDLKPLEIQQIVSWIQSVRGSNPPNAKAPQGELYKDESLPAADSSQTATTDSIPTQDSVKK